MKSIKRVKGLTVIIFCFLFLVIPNIVQADIIWEPEDDFYIKHRNECVYEGRRCYSSNNEDGNIITYKSPESKKKVGTYSIPEGYYVQYTYEDKLGVKWGVLSLEGKTSWIPMSRLTLIYDFQSFNEDYQDKFEKYNRDYDDILANPFLLWTFPGSGEVEARYEKPDSLPTINETYRDEKDRLWGKVDYYYKLQGWICLDAPTDENIPAFGNHKLIKTNPTDTKDVEDLLNQKKYGVWIFPIVLVAVLVSVTAIIIKVLYKKGNSH